MTLTFILLSIHIQKIKFKGQSVQKIKWKQTDKQKDRRTLQIATSPLMRLVSNNTCHFGHSVVVEELSRPGRVVGSIVDGQLNGVDAGRLTREPEAVVRWSDVLGVQRWSSLFQLTAATEVHVVDLHVVALDVRGVVSPATHERLNDGVLQFQQQHIPTLENVQSYWHAGSRLPPTDTKNRYYQIRPFDLRINACLAPDIDRNSTDFDVDDVHRFPCWAHRQTDRHTHRHSWKLYPRYTKAAGVDNYCQKTSRFVNAMTCGRAIRHDENSKK